jgi:hypothetical protein
MLALLTFTIELAVTLHDLLLCMSIVAYSCAAICGAGMADAVTGT